MHIKHLEIKSFRSFENLSLSFSPALNLLLGENARGKTTVLEAIHLLCLARSFRTRSDVELCRFGESEYQISGTFIVQNQIKRKVIVSYCEASGRSVSIGGKQVLRYSELIGNFPAIVLSSQDHCITTGPPAERRRFADILLCQLSTRYLADLKDYYRVLKQRNHILQDCSRGKKIAAHEIEPWNHELVKKGSEIIKARHSLCKELTVILADVYHRVSGSKATFKIEYIPNVKFLAKDEPREAFQKALKKAEIQERNMGFSLVGPHRDDFLFLLEKNELRRFGSRGEHKTALISLKAAESQLVIKRKAETPVLLLDDLFTELDDQRSKNVLDVFKTGYQILVTSSLPESNSIKTLHSDLQSEVKVFEFKTGAVVKSPNG